MESIAIFDKFNIEKIDKFKIENNYSIYESSFNIK